MLTKRSEVASWFESSLSLKHRQRGFEKDIAIFLQTRPSLLGVAAKTTSTHNKHTEAVPHQDIQRLEGLLQETHKEIRCGITKISSGQATPELCALVKTFSTQADALHHSLRMVEQSFQTTTEALESKLQRLYQTYDVEEDEWEDVLRGIPQSQTVKGAAIPTSCSSQSTHTHAPPEIAEYDQFVRNNHGVTGGWDPRDHAEFIRVYGKHQGNIENNPSARGELLRLIPGLQDEDITPHIRFVVEYEEVLQRKKDAVLRWRVTKDADAMNAKALEAHREQRMLEERRDEVLRKKQEAESQRAHLKTDVLQWKQQREYEKHIQSMVTLEQNLLHKKAEEEKRRRAKEKAQEALAMRDALRTAQALQHQTTVHQYLEEKVMKGKEANIALKCRKAQDDALIEKKKERILTKQQQLTQKENIRNPAITKRSSTPRSSSVERFQKLIQPTESASARKLPPQRSRSVPVEGEGESGGKKADLQERECRGGDGVLMRGRTYMSPTPTLYTGSRKATPAWCGPKFQR